MRLSEFSKDKITADGLRDFRTRLTTEANGCFQPIRTGMFREGVAVSGAGLKRYLIQYCWAASTQGGFMTVVEELKENYAEAEKLWKSYDAKLTEFRSAIKNDVASLEASARKTTDAVQKMNKAYGDVVTQLNSNDMLQAVENAERLATAISALSALQSHKLVFAVTDQSK